MDGLPQVFVAGTQAASVELNRGRVYTVHHLAVDAVGAEELDTIFLGIGGAPDADHAAGEGKIVLQAGRAVDVGPHVAAIHYRTAAGAPAFQILPSQVIPASQR